MTAWLTVEVTESCIAMSSVAFASRAATALALSDVLRQATTPEKLAAVAAHYAAAVILSLVLRPLAALRVVGSVVTVTAAGAGLRCLGCGARGGLVALVVAGSGTLASVVTGFACGR